MSDPVEPRLEVVVGDTALTPGQPASVTVMVRNLEWVARSYAFVFVGIDEAWTVPPGWLGPLAPGQSGTATFVITLPPGFPATDIAARLDVEPMDPETGVAAGAPVSTDTLLAVGDGAAISGSLDPTDIRGRERGRLRILLHNRGRNPIRVELTAASVADAVMIRFSEPVVVVEPGEEFVVRATLRGQRPRYGKPVRRPFVIRAQGRSAPLLLDGAFTQKAVVSSTAFKIAAVVAVVGLWVLVALLAVGRLSKSTQHKATAASQGAPAAGSPIAGGVTGGTGSGSGGAGGGNGGAGGAGGGGASGAGAGAGSAGAGSSGGGAGAAGASGAGTGTSATFTQISGKVTAPDPSGVTVSLKPTSLVAQSDTGGATSSQLASSAPGKVLADLSAPIEAASIGTTASVTTDSDGAWTFHQVTTPGYYTVTFTKAGYQSTSYVVTTAVDNAPITLAVTMTPGTGSLGGTVFGPNGPLGGAAIAISNGTVTLNTQTPTTGSVGTWLVKGLSTPGTYLVTATEAGYATQSALIPLSAQQSNTNVALTMPVGVATITGTVSGPEPTGVTGVGGVTVSVTSGSSTVMATTSTDAANLGMYSIPNLPIPGMYTLTVSGTGWISQTQQVTLDSTTTPSPVNATLVPTTGSVTGFVETSQADSAAANATDPDPSSCHLNPPQAASPYGLSNAGLVLSNGTTTYKALTASAPPGQFAFDTIPPGHYTLTSTAFEYGTQVAQVDVIAGAPAATATLVVPCMGPTDNSGASLIGQVQNLATGQPLFGAPLGSLTVTVDQGPPAAVSYPPTGGYSISGLSAGIHQISANYPGFDGPVTVQATVGVDMSGVAPPIFLPLLNTLTGTVSSNAGGPAAGAVVTVFDASGQTVVGTGVANAQGLYQITNTLDPSDGTGLPHGTYLVYASGTGFVPSQVPAAVTGSSGPTTTTTLPASTTTAPSSTTSTTVPGPPLPKATQVNIPVDTDQTVNFSLDQLPILNVSTMVTGPNGTLNPVGGVAFSLASSGGGSSTLSTGAGGTLSVASPTESTVFGLGTVANSYTLSGFNPPSPDMFQTCELATASTLGIQLPSCQFTAALNQTYFLTALSTDFTVPPGGVMGTLVYAQRSQTAQVPVPTGPTVSMTGLASFSLGTGGSPGVPVYHTYTTTADPTTGVFTFPNTDVNLASTADFMVNGLPAFMPFNITQVQTQGTRPTGADAEPLDPFQLTPVPVPVSGTVTLNPTPAGPTPYSGVTAVVTAPSGAPSPVTVSVNPTTGQILWNDPVTGSRAQPDTYDVTFTKPGFDPTTAPGVPGTATTPVVATIGLCGAAPCPTNPLPVVNLNQLATVTAAAVQPGDSGPSPVDGATFTLFDNGNPVGSPVAAAPGANSVAFPGLSLINQDYTVVAVAPGYAIPSGVPVAVTPGCACTASVTLQALGTIAGTIQTQLFLGGPTSPAAGAVVTLSPAPAGCAYTATTDATGSFSITGGTTPACQGLEPGEYSVSASLPGYATNTTSALVSDGTTSSVSVTLLASPITVTGTVTDSATSAGLPGVLVTFVNGATGAQTATTDANGDFSLSLAPLAYTVSFTKTGYAPVVAVPVDLVPTVTPASLAIPMTMDENTLSGTTNSVSPSGAATPLSGVTVTVTDVTNPLATPIPPATSDATGHYTINNIPDDTYQVTFGETGYVSPPPQTVPMTGGNSYAADGALTPAGHPVAVTVTSDVDATAVGNATVTLNGVSAPTDSSGTAVFASVPPGVYPVTVDGRAAQALGQPTPHLGPPTAATANITVPQGTGVSPAAVVLQEGEIAGSTASAGGAAVTVVITPSGGGIPLTFVTSTASYAAYVPADSYTVTFQAAGFNNDTHANVAVTNTNVSTVNAALTPLFRTVQVTVTSAVGPVVANAAVSLDGATETTNASGIATFASVPAGTYPVTVDGRAAQALGQPTPHLGPPTAATANVTVPQGTGTSSAAVVLQEGEITGSTASAGGVAVTVVITPSGGGIPLTFVTSSGSYAAYLPGGTYTVTFEAAGYSNDTHAGITVTNGSTTSLNANLAPLDHTVTVQVQSATAPGAGVNGVAVTLTPTGNPSPQFGPLPTATVGSSDGIVTFLSVPPGSYTISADGSGTTPPHLSAALTNVSVPIGVTNPSTQVVTIAEAEITGSINPASATVTLTSNAVGHPVTTPTVSSPSGNFDAFVIPGSTYTVGASADGYNPLSPAPGPIPTLNGVQYPLGALTLSPLTHSVTIAVVSAVDSQPLGNAIVTLGSPGSPHLTTDATTGIATFTGIPPSATPYTIAVTDTGHPNGSGSVLVPVSVNDPPPATVTVNEVEIAGSAPGGETVTITSNAPPTTIAIMPAGNFQEFLAPGTYTVVTSQDGFQATQVRDVLSTAGESDMSAGGALAPLTLTVTVTSPFSSPVVGATVSGTGGLGTMTTDSTGTVTFTGVAQGNYTLAVTAVSAPHVLGPPPPTVMLTVSTDETASLTATLRLTEGEITGTIALASGSSCTDTAATVMITGGPTPVTIGGVAIAGSYSALLSPGHYTVNFSTPSSCTPPSPRSVTITNGQVSDAGATFP